MNRPLSRLLLILTLFAAACGGATGTPTPSSQAPTAIAVVETKPPDPTRTAPVTPTVNASPTLAPQPTATPTVTAPATATATVTAPPTRTPTATVTATPTATPPPTATPDPYVGLTVADLAARTYGGGALRVEETLAVTGAFTRSLVTFPSDGLTIYGFMNVPRGEGPFPAVVVTHGYVDPSVYTTLAYTTRYADALAWAGYVAIHPNLRNYPPSDDAPEEVAGRETSDFRVGMAVDVLNLTALIQAQGGQPGPLRKADPDNVGLWGHSMGGGITLRNITVNPDVRAAVLYGSMSGDERKNYEKILAWSGGQRGEAELATPDEDLARISPIFHLERIEAAVSIHHGELDGTVPLEWSLDLCQRLTELGKTVECFTYPRQPHTFGGEGDQLFIQRTIAFFDRHLKGSR